MLGQPENPSSARGRASADKQRMRGGPEVTLHARASMDDGPSTNPLHSQPTTTCFGFRRRKKAQPKEPAMWVKNPPPAGESKPATPSSRGEAHRPEGEKVQQRMCGMGDILCSFTSDIYDTHTHRDNRAAAIHAGESVRACEGAEKPSLPLESKDSGRSTESGTPTPRIMASYDSIYTEGASQRGGGYSEDGARETDGADSIVDDIHHEDEEYDSFGSPQWTIDPHDIFFISKGDGSNKVCRLGKGEYGPVYLGVWQEQEVAVKLARQAPISLKTEKQFQANVARLHALSHANIVTFLGACCWKGGKRSVMVSEFMDKSDLRTLLGRADLAPKFAWREHGQTVALDVAHGLQYLHARGLAHGRLKCGNVLMNKAGVAKLSDVALASLLSHCKTVSAEKVAPRAPTGAGGTFHADMSPPEGPGHAKEGSGKAGDIFCLGLILHELLTYQPPNVTRLRPIKTPEEAPAKIAYLVECCLDEDPDARPSIDRVVSILSGRRPDA